MLRERGQSVLHPDPRALDLADKLEAEPEPSWRQQDGGEVGDEPLRFTIRWDHLAHEYRVSVPNLSGQLQVVPADAYDDVRRERDEARETLEAFVDAFTRDIGKVLAPLPSAERHRIVYDCMRSTYSALARAEEAMDGVERTHTPVPVEMCRRASALYRVTAHQHPVGSVDRELATAHAEAFETAGRGEPVGEWPT